MLTNMTGLILMLLMSAAFARAEFLRVDVAIRDMNCEPCSQSLQSALERMRGVEKVEVDFKTAVVRVKLSEKLASASIRYGMLSNASDSRPAKPPSRFAARCTDQNSKCLKRERLS